MSGNESFASSFFRQAQSLKAIGKIGMRPPGKKKRGGPGQEIDGDGDGVIYDGTAQERPVVRRMPQGLKPEAGTVPAIPKRKPAPLQKPAQPAQQAQPVTPKPKPQPKPSPMQKQREAAGKEPKPPKPQKPAIVDAATGATVKLMHKVAPKSIDKAQMAPMAKAAIHNAAGSMTQQRSSEIAAQYEQDAQKLWNLLPIKRETQTDPNLISRVMGDDDRELYFKKAKEFDEKAALWAHYAENPADAQKPIAIKPTAQKSFDELMPLKASSADVGVSGPSSWDDLDSYTQSQVQEDWTSDRMRDSDFLEWVGESVRENVDTKDVISENLDELLPDIDWEYLDVGQAEVADQIESTVKEAIDGGLKIGKEMTDADLESIRIKLTDSAAAWKDGDLDNDKVEELIDLVTASLNQSEPGVVNIPGEDDIAEIIQIDDDEAADQIYAAWRRGKSWTSGVEQLIDNKVEEMMNDDDVLQEYADEEWNNMDSDSSFEAARNYGHAEGGGYDSDSEGSSYELSNLGIDDAASFVGAPEGSTVSVSGTSIEVEGPGGLRMEREISGKSIYAAYFRAGSQYKGEGAQIFSQMVRQARAAEFEDISVSAAGSLGGSMNGYYTWPLLGYERNIRGLRQEDEIRQKFPNVETIQDLFDAPGGRDYWFVNGSSLSMDFDLNDGSRSMQVLERYLNERSSR
jgi:hypothetical protein